MSTLLPAGLAYLPGFSPEPQKERLAGDPAHSKAAEAQAPPAKEETTSTQQADPAGKPRGGMEACGGGSMSSMLLYMVPIFLIMYFLMIRPQQKQEKKRKALLAAVKKGDKVVTNAGIHGSVVELDEQTLTLKIDTKGEVRVKFERSVVTRILNQDQG